jgi:hypothetical protein
MQSITHPHDAPATAHGDLTTIERALERTAPANLLELVGEEQRGFDWLIQRARA